MSGESGRTPRQSSGQRVRPEPVIEKSFVENVTGFINEVVPQTYQNPSHYEGKERICWVKFDQCDINDFAQFRDSVKSNGNVPPFLLIIGYVNGVQAWVIPANGEAVEVFSWRQGPVRTLKVLVTPITSNKCLDKFSLKRPIFAICDAAGPGAHFHSVAFISFKSNEQVKTIKFKNAVQDIHSNKNVVVISFVEKLAIFDAASLDDLFTISSCFPCPGPSLNPVALGDQWLAYAERKLYSVHQSCGGVVTDGVPSYKSTVFHAAKSITKGLKELGETVASNFMGQKSGYPTGMPQQPCQSVMPGVVTIINTTKVDSSEVTLNDSQTPYLVAHFVAHSTSPVVALQFDPSGMLLATADKPGHAFHIFRIQPHSVSSSQAAVHHIYTLYRGDTTAKVMDISFSLDSRWITFATHRGTTHVYPITPYGGAIGLRTHKSVCVVNRQSRFQRSAGLEEKSSERSSPILSTSPMGPKYGLGSKFSFEASQNMAYHNPRYPPFPVPTLVRPLAQLRQPLLQNLLETITAGPSPSHGPTSSNSSKEKGPEEIVRVCSTFGVSRGWLAGSPTIPHEPKQRCVDSLFVMAYHGNLIEYYIEPRISSLVPLDKKTGESSIELEVHAIAQWSLIREFTSVDLRPPLPQASPLLYPQIPLTDSPISFLDNEDPEERWMSQVEIYTHAGPPRRLWMGPQFTFKTIPGTGKLAEPDPIMDADPSLLILPNRSSPVNMPGMTAVHIEAGSLTSIPSPSPRLESSSSGGEPVEPLMSRLKNELADAMNDIPVKKKQDSGVTGSEAITDDYGFDFSDVMDISCDPPGPFSSSSRGPTPSRLSSGQEEIRGVTAKLRQVSVTCSSPSLPIQPFWGGSRTPSLEECKGLTSSAEELAFTLEGIKVESSLSSNVAWRPIDPPSSKVPASKMEKPVVEKAKPVKKMKHQNNFSEEKTISDISPNCWTSLSLKSDDEFSQSKNKDSNSLSKHLNEDFLESSFRKVDTDPSKEMNIENTYVPYEEPASEQYPPIGTMPSLMSSVQMPGSKSNTTSDDDQFLVREVRKDKKKKKKRKDEDSEKKNVKLEVKSSGPTSISTASIVVEQPSALPLNVWNLSNSVTKEVGNFGDSDVGLSVKRDEYPDLLSNAATEDHWAPNPETDYYGDNRMELDFISDICNLDEDPLLVDRPPSSPPSIDVETEQFHTAEEFHDPIDDYAPPSPLEEDLEILEESIDALNESARVEKEILLSIHSDEDLAKALEEASSDESSLVKSRSVNVNPPREADEMFPFRDTSSGEDDEYCGQRVRKRGAGIRCVLNPRVSKADDEDDTTTSGDDRKTTSESDVTNSPNPRASNGKGKKKKKKKK